MVISEILLCPVLTLLLQFAYTMSPPLFVALFSGSRSIVHWRHCIGTYVKYEICIRYVLISSLIWLSQKFYCSQFSLCYCNLRTPCLLALYVALISGSRGIVHWGHCIGTYMKYEICIRYVLISSSIRLSRKFYCAQFSLCYCKLRTPCPPTLFFCSDICVSRHRTLAALYWTQHKI
jgi:hypothetical protein